MPAAKRRPCAKCNKNRAEKFYVSARGRVCSFCRKRRTQLASRDVRLMENYGITQAEFDLIMEYQQGVCAICDGKRSYPLDTDHDHALEKAGVPLRETVRGALCRQCNRRILRSVRDSIELLEAAIRYLKNPPARQVLSTVRSAGADRILSHHRPVE